MTIDKSQRFTTLVRLGFAARGLTYTLLGVLALGTSGAARAGPQGVFDYLQDIPLGGAILGAVALGLLGYAAFKLLSGISNIEHHPGDAKGIGMRVGDIGSGLMHLLLAYAAYRFATGAKAAAETGAEAAMVQPVMDLEVGPLLIGLAGLGMLIAAVVQAKHAATGDFMRQIASSAPRAVKTVGRIGHAARAVVFAIIGWSLVRAAWLDAEGAVKGLGEALVSLRDMGMIFTAVAIGLILFGAFSLVTARYRIIPDLKQGDLRPQLPG